MTIQTFELVAQKRVSQVKNSSKKAVVSQEIVGVVYNKKTNIPIIFNRHDFNKIFNKMNSNSLINLKIGEESYTTIIKEIAYFPKNRFVEHIDFYHLPKDELISVKVPIEFQGLPVGIAKGGLMRKFSNALFIKCKAEEIPDKINIDISHLDISMNLYLRDLDKQDSFSFLESSDKALISIVRTSKSKSTEDAKEGQAKQEENTKEGDSQKATTKK